MNDLNLETVYIEGIKEKIESLVENDVYNRYGALIAKGKVDFDSKILEDMTEIMKVVAKFNKDIAKSLDW